MVFARKAHRIAERLGGDFEFSTLRALNLDDVSRLITTPPLHRFKNRVSVSFYPHVIWQQVNPLFLSRMFDFCAESTF
jgi:hypothetical protein